MKDRLYLLKPNFLDQGKAYFCPGWAQVEGMLSFYPGIREKIEVHYIEFPRPRARLVAEIGGEPGMSKTGPWRRARHSSKGDCRRCKGTPLHLRADRDLPLLSQRLWGW